MPIHDLSYRHWSGEYSDTPPALILSWAQLKVVTRRKMVRFLMLLGALFSLVFLALLYAETMQKSGSFDFLPQVHLDERSIHVFLFRQKLLHILFCIAAGADIIALDRQHKALQIYLSHPMSAFDYLLGKGAPLVFFLSLTSWIPALLLIVMKCFMTAELGWLREAPGLPLSILGYSILMIIPLTLMTLAVSSTSSSPRLASVQLFAVLFLSWGATQILSPLSGSDYWHLLSPLSLLDQVCSWMFGFATPYDYPAVLALISLILLSAASAYVLRSRIRAIDIVGGA